MAKRVVAAPDWLSVERGSSVYSVSGAVGFEFDPPHAMSAASQQRSQLPGALPTESCARAHARWCHVDASVVVLGLWIVIQLISGIGSIANTTESGGVAYMAHIGGFVAGLLLVKPMAVRRPAATIA